MIEQVLLGCYEFYQVLYLYIYIERIYIYAYIYMSPVNSIVLVPAI